MNTSLTNMISNGKDVIVDSIANLGTAIVTATDNALHDCISIVGDSNAPYKLRKQALTQQGILSGMLIICGTIVITTAIREQKDC